MTKRLLNLILRGHVRNGFDDNRMYEFVQYLDTLFDLQIYIHSWTVKQSSVSHRRLEQQNDLITNTHFEDYFKALSARIRHIDIENDEEIHLIGKVEGRMFPNGGSTPLIGWKRMIHGKFKMIQFVRNLKKDQSELVLDTRFDLFPVHDHLSIFYKLDAHKFASDHANSPIVKNVFCVNDDYKYGVDNMYFGSIQSCFELNYAFHHDLDTIVARNTDLINPEFLYARESRAMYKQKLVNFVSTIPNVHTYPLQFVLENMKFHHDPNTLWLEFGTASGRTINYISGFSPHPVYGFDSFEGLPELWRPGFPKGAFDMKGTLPSVRENVRLVKGWFSDTLTPFLAEHTGLVSFLHIDCDIYSSTKYVLETLRDRLAPGCIIVFDELVNYDGFDEDNGELHAFYEFITTYKLSFEWIGMNGTPTGMRGYYHENVAVRLH